MKNNNKELLIKVISVFLFIAYQSTCFSQSKNTPFPIDSLKNTYETKKDIVFEKKALQSAMQYNDYTSAITIMHTIISKEPKNKLWRDSLCILYFMNKSFLQAINAATDVLAGTLEKENIALILAISNKSVNNLKESLNVYEKLYQRYANPYYLFEAAALQYYLQRNAEFELSINQLIKIAESSQQPLNIALYTEKGEMQSVPLKAASLNLKGVMLKDNGKTKEATDCFEEALKIMASFKLAATNLESIKLNTKK